MTTPPNEPSGGFLPPSPEPFPQSQPQPVPQPHPSQLGYPIGPPGGAGVPLAAPMGWGPAPAAPPSRSTRVIAIIALCLAGVATLGVIILFLLGFFASGGGGDLEGTAPQVVDGQPYSGETLAREVQHVFEYDGWSVGSMHCPNTPHVDYDANTTCHGVVDHYEEDVTVDFQDAAGHFKVYEN